MTFGSPGLALVGMAAVALPILIHLLLRRRQPPLEWAAMELLRRAVRRTNRRRRLERWALLAARCALIALAGLAIARPLVSATSSDGGHGGTTIILIDNGATSFESAPGARTTLTHLKERAAVTIAALKVGDRVAIVPLAQPEAALLPPTRDLSAAASFVQALTPSPRGADTSRALKIIQDNMLGADGSPDLVLLSSFRAGTVARGSELEMVPPPNSLELDEPRTTPVPNMWVSRVEVESPAPGANSGDVPVRITLGRSSVALEQQRVEVRIRDTSGGVGSAHGEFRPGEQSLTTTGTLAHQERLADGVFGVEAQIGPDSQPADNQGFAVHRTVQRPRVLIVDRATAVTDTLADIAGSTWIGRALDPDGQGAIEVERSEPANITSARLRGFDAVLVLRPDLVDGEGWTALREQLNQGASLILFPPPTGEPSGWVDELRSLAPASWTIGDAVVEFPGGMSLAPTQPRHHATSAIRPELETLLKPIVVYRAVQLHLNESDSGAVLVSASSAPILAITEGPNGKGTLVVFAVAPALSWSNIPAKPLMVPLIQEVVRQCVSEVNQGRPLEPGLSVVVGAGVNALQQLPFPGDGAGARIEVGADGITTTAIESPGVYQVIGPRGAVESLWAVNAPVDSADISPVSSVELANWTSGLSAKEISSGRSTSTTRPDDSSTNEALVGAALTLAIAAAGIETILARQTTRVTRSA